MKNNNIDRINIYYIKCKIGPHPVHKIFAKSVKAKFIPCCKYFKNIYLSLFENIFRSLFIKNNSILIIEGMESIYLGVFAKIFKKNIHLIYHDTDFFFYNDYNNYLNLKKKFLDFFLEKIDFIITDSKLSKTNCLKYLDKKINVVYPFVKLNKFKFKPNLNSKNIIFVGRFADEKNLFTLIDAYKIIVTKYKNSKLYLVGDGPLRVQLEEYIKINKLNNVIFLGWCKNFNKYLNDSLIGYNVSKFEAFGVVGLEYVASGVIPLLGKNNGNAELYNNYSDNIIVQNINYPKLIAEKITNLFEMKLNDKKLLINKLYKITTSYDEKIQIEFFQKEISNFIKNIKHK